MPKKQITEIIEQVNSEKSFRTLEITREAVNENDRTIELSFSSEEPYERWFGFEILDHKTGAMRQDRLKNSAPLLWNHDRDAQIGVVEKVWLDGLKGRALVRFSKSAKADEIYQDVLDNIRRNVSVGYLVHKMVLEEQKDDVETYRVVDWEPFEVSMVSIPADFSVGVGRTIEENNQPKEHTKMPEKDIQIKEVPRELTDAERVELEKKFHKELAGSAKEIFAMGEKFNQRELAIDFVREGKSVDEFRMEVLTRLGQAKTVNTNPNIGMNEREVKEFSFLRAINALAAGDMKLAPYEKEVSDAAAKHLGKEVRGLLVPMDVLQAKRDLTVGTSGSAGGGYYMVGTDHMASSFIELLRNKTLVRRLGARVLDGLVGNVAIPKQTGGATAYWVTEASAAITESNQTTGQVALTPKTVGAMVDISRKLAKQASPAAEQFVREDIASVLAIATDLAALHGTGSDGQPTGIAATSGIGSVAGGTNGLAPAYSHIVGLESQVAIDNADFGSLAYLSNTKVRGVLKQIFTNATYGERPVWGDGKEAGVGEMNGYPAFVSNQVSSALTKGTSSGVASAIFFGNWADLIIAEWGGLDLTVDPYTLSSSGGIRVVGLQDMDIAVRHAESFAAMLDALTA